MGWSLCDLETSMEFWAWPVLIQVQDLILFWQSGLSFFLFTTLGVFTFGDARSFSGLASKIPPLLNFDADVKKTTARHPYENPL